MHIKTDHDKHQTFECDKCEKHFVIEWRLKKHMHLHTQINIKRCHYFNNEKTYPFNELGCKFQHSVAEKCKFGQKCKRRLCPNRHEKRGHLGSDIDSTIDKAENGEIFETETDFDTIMTSKEHLIVKNALMDCSACQTGQSGE